MTEENTTAAPVSPESTDDGKSVNESQKKEEKVSDEKKTKATPEKKKTQTKKPTNSKESSASNFVVSLSDIELPERWNREKPGNLGSLTTSLKTIGQVVALVVKPHPDKKGKYLLVDGRRRYMALQDLKVKEAAVTFTDGDETEMYTKSLVANINREGHNPLEIANAFSELIEGGMNNRQIARACGVSEGHVSQHLALLDLDSAVQKAISKEVISMSQARVLCKVNVEEHSTFFFRLFEQMVTKGLSAQEADEKTKAYLDRYKQREKEKAAAKKAKDAAEGKAPKDGGKTGEEPEKKGPGRPEAKVPTYDDKKADINPANKTALLGYLNGHSERLARATSDKTKQFLKGVLHGLELASGLKE